MWRRATVRGNGGAVGQKYASVLKYDHAVAQQAPTLLGVPSDDACGFVINRIGARTRGVVVTHC